MNATVHHRQKWPQAARVAELVAFLARRSRSGRKLRVTSVLLGVSGLTSILLLRALGWEEFLATSLVSLTLYLYLIVGYLLTRQYLTPTTHIAERIALLRGSKISPFGTSFAYAAHLLELYCIALGPAIAAAYWSGPRAAALRVVFWLLLSTALLSTIVASLIFVAKHFRLKRPMIFVLGALLVPLLVSPDLSSSSLSVPTLIWKLLRQTESKVGAE